MPPQTETIRELAPWQYGVLGAIALVFALAIIYLFRRYERRERRLELERKSMIEERKAWDAERMAAKASYDLAVATMRTELEGKYADELKREHEESREREDAIRAEFAALMEKLSNDQLKGSEATTAVLNKFYDRFVSPRARY